MQLAGLLSDITPGAIYPVAIGAVAQVGIDNDSPYDVWVSFGPQQPLAAPGSTTTALYNGVARSMATSYFPVPDLTPPFGGIIYLGVYNPAGLASSGVISSRAQVYISILQTGEAPGAVFAVPRLSDTSNQPRNIAVPIGLTHWGTTQIVSGTTAGLIQQLQSAFVLTAAQKAASTATFYFYGVWVSAYSVAGTAQADMRIETQFLHAGARIGVAFPVVRFGIGVQAGGSGPVFTFAPANPFVVQFNGNMPATADAIEVHIITLGASASVTMDVTTASNLDLTNLVPVADIGTAALYNSSEASF